MLSIEVKGLTELKADLRRSRSLLSKTNFVAQITHTARNIIVNRTLSGKDVDGNDFKDYSTKPIYIPKDHRPKPKGGRKTKGGESVFYEGGYAEFASATKGFNDPNLYGAGDMMRAFQVKSISDKKATVHFTKTQEALKAIANNATRQFVGINTATELPKLQKQFLGLVNRELNKAGL